MPVMDILEAEKEYNNNQQVVFHLNFSKKDFCTKIKIFDKLKTFLWKNMHHYSIENAPRRLSIHFLAPNFTELAEKTNRTIRILTKRKWTAEIISGFSKERPWLDVTFMSERPFS